MAEIVITASVILIILLILIQNISARFLYSEKLLIEIDYSLFTLLLTEEKGKTKALKISPKLWISLKRSLEFLLQHSELEISKIKFKTDENDPKKFSIRYRNAFSLFSALTVYLSKKTKKLNISDDSIVIFSDEEEKNSFFLDVKITAPLYVSLVFAAMFLLILLKNKKLKKIKQSEKENA